MTRGAVNDEEEALRSERAVVCGRLFTAYSAITRPVAMLLPSAAIAETIRTHRSCRRGLVRHLTDPPRPHRGLQIEVDWIDVSAARAGREVLVIDGRTGEVTAGTVSRATAAVARICDALCLLQFVSGGWPVSWRAQMIKWLDAEFDNLVAAWCAARLATLPALQSPGPEPATAVADDADEAEVGWQVALLCELSGELTRRPDQKISCVPGRDHATPFLRVVGPADAVVTVWIVPARSGWRFFWWAPPHGGLSHATTDMAGAAERLRRLLLDRDGRAGSDVNSGRRPG